MEIDSHFQDGDECVSGHDVGMPDRVEEPTKLAEMCLSTIHSLRLQANAYCSGGTAGAPTPRAHAKRGIPSEVMSVVNGGRKSRPTIRIPAVWFSRSHHFRLGELRLPGAHQRQVAAYGHGRGAQIANSARSSVDRRETRPISQSRYRRDACESPSCLPLAKRISSTESEAGRLLPG